MSWINVLLKNIKVTDLGDNFEVQGLRSWVLFREIGLVFGTTRIQNGMFHSVKSTSFMFSRFFIYDFYEVVKVLSENGGRLLRSEYIEKLLTSLEELPEIKRTKKDFRSILDRSVLKNYKYEPLPHQEDFFKEYSQNKQRYELDGYILASVPGSGKTLTSLMLMDMLGKDITVVFSPNNALNEVWGATISEIRGIDPDKVYIYPNPLTRYDYEYYVFSHENTKFALEHAPKIRKNNLNASLGIIVDECHRFTELIADQTNNLITICKLLRSNDILFMSGTPFKALGREIIPFLMATDRLFTKKVMEGFKKIAAASNQVARQILAARIGRTLFRVDKADVIKNKVLKFTVKIQCPDGQRYTLPAIKEKMQRYIEERSEYYNENAHKLVAEYRRIVALFESRNITAKNRKEFEQYKRDAERIRNTRDLMSVIEEMKSTNRYERLVILPTLSPADKVIFKNVKSVYKYLQLKIRGEALGNVLAGERLACNVSIMNNINNGTIYSDDPEMNGKDWTLQDLFAMSKTKVVMFSDYIEVLKASESVLKEEGLSPALVYGETNKDFSNIIERFEKDPNVNPIVATYKSLSTAVPLVMADTCVLLNTPFRDYIYQQTTARIDRLGQKQTVLIYTYQLDTGDVPNVSTRSNDIMEWSRKMVEELLGISTDEELEGAAEETMESLICAVPEAPSLFDAW